MDQAVIERNDLQGLLDALIKSGYQVVGPAIREGVIVYDKVASVSDLPAGWTDEQGAGTYRIKKRGDAALFGYAAGPHSWKKFLFPPASRLCQIQRTTPAHMRGTGLLDQKQGGARTGDGLEIAEEQTKAPKLAFLGVRSCELQAIAIQDKVFLGGAVVDPIYKARRESIFLIAVNCGQPGGTCFCASMNTGPKAALGFDLALTEILHSGRHYFLVETGSAKGAELLAEVPHRSATTENVALADGVISETAKQMGKSMDTRDIKELLYRNLEHPRWEEVAKRCLACANCTMACPTCFCSTVEDVTDLTGNHAERWRKWDSCFTADFSYIHGGSVRSSIKARYRQWMTHKLGTWIDQFGTSGCVGCGRCITWCPVGIDITEEVRAIRESEKPATTPLAGSPTT